MALAVCTLFTGSTADAATRGEVVVVAARGEASVTMAGMTVPLAAGAILQLPATVRTGADGALELRQGSSTFAVAADTELEIPQSAAEDGLIERIIQIRGNAFYNVGKRTRTRLRVEAPYLVAVVKGTQFNVASRDNGTTIALFEGHLEVHAADGSDVVDLHAGEIAIRNRSEVSISILRLSAMREASRRQQAAAAQSQSAATAGSRNEMAARVEAPGGASETALAEQGGAALATSEATAGVSNAPADGVVAVTADSTVAAGNVSPAAVASLDLGRSAIDTGTSAAVDLASRGIAVDAGASAAIDLASRSIAVESSIGAGSRTVSAGASAGAPMDTGTGSVAVAVNGGAVGAAVDVAVGRATDGGTDGVGAVAEFGNPRAAARVNSAVGVGGTTAVDASAGVAGDLDVRTGVNAGRGNPGVAVEVGGVDISLGVDRGHGLRKDNEDSDDGARDNRRGRQRR